LATTGCFDSSGALVTITSSISLPSVGLTSNGETSVSVGLISVSVGLISAIFSSTALTSIVLLSSDPASIMSTASSTSAGSSLAG